MIKLIDNWYGSINLLPVFITYSTKYTLVSYFDFIKTLILLQFKTDFKVAYGKKKKKLFNLPSLETSLHLNEINVYYI